MPSLIFYLFSAIAVIGAICLVSFRNPVSSALSMVLFIFIIMLLDLNSEEKVTFKSSTVFAGVLLPLLLAAQVLGVIQDGPEDTAFAEINTATMAKSAEAFKREGDVEQTAIYKSLTHEKTPKLPDTNLIGDTIFKSYNFPLQVMGVLLLVATIGVVVLSKRTTKKANS